MPIDPASGSEVVCHLVDLLPHSKEYQDVSQAFHQTMTAGAHLHRTAQTYQNLKKIQRVQNPKLWGQYMARKKVMEKDNPQGCQNERRLFHGCRQDSVQPINYTGFNRSYAGRNGMCVCVYMRACVHVCGCVILCVRYIKCVGAVDVILFTIN